MSKGFFWPVAFGLLMAACNSDQAPDLVQNLPDTSLAMPQRNCTIIEDSVVVTLKRNSNAEDQAVMRHEAYCLPDVMRPYNWHVPYRIEFEQVFTKRKQYPGDSYIWVGTETRFFEEVNAPSMLVDASAEGLGKNCMLLVKKFENMALPCINSIDQNIGDRTRDLLEKFKLHTNFNINVKGQSHLNTILLDRDATCLDYWQQVQHQLDSRFDACSVN